MGPPPGVVPPPPPPGPRASAPVPGEPRVPGGRDGPAAWGPRPPPWSPAPGGLPTSLLLLDYAIRLLIIAAAAAWGARWLARPMRTMVGAARELGPALAQGRPVPHLDEAAGTLEVREGARVFNSMAAQLDEQLRSRELLAAALSHDLRTPLTRMRMRLETLEALETPDEAGCAAQRCIADVGEMNQLIDSSLALIRTAGEPMPRQAVDVAALLQSLVDDLAEQGADVHCAGGPGAAPALALAEPAALRRVLSNLLGNALRYGGRTEVSVHDDGHRLQVHVDDHGPGVPPEQLEAVFRPFYRLEASRSRDTGGAGLGLYIARDLVRRQGGELVLHNRMDGGRIAGLRAELTLPRAPQQA